MNKLHHPHNRAERLKLKVKKSNTSKSGSRPNARKRSIEEAKAKEAEHDLRVETLGIKEEI